MLSPNRPPQQGAASPALPFSWPSILVYICCGRRPEPGTLQNVGRGGEQARQHALGACEARAAHLASSPVRRRRCGTALLLAADAAAACAAWCRSAGAGPPALQGLDLLLRMREMSQMPAQGPGRVSWPKALLAGFAGSLASYEAGRRRCARSSADAPPGARLPHPLRPRQQGAAAPALRSS